ncbi:MAG: NAD(P)-dependent oxidoreductase [Pseudomonadota bacterium]
MEKIAVTGGNSNAGRYIVDELLRHDYDVLVIDHFEDICAPQAGSRVDLTNYSDVFTLLSEWDAVVHLGKEHLPHSKNELHAVRQFSHNTIGTYNVFRAAAKLGMHRVVWANSESVLGSFLEKPKTVPLDENCHVKVSSDFALSQVMCQRLAEEISQLFGMPIVGLRFCNLIFDDVTMDANYRQIPKFWKSPFAGRSNLWSYLDARDAATSVRLALEADISSAENFLISAGDTIMNWPNKKLIESVFPGVEIKQGTGDFQSLLSTEKARKMLGFAPRYSWRDFVGEQTEPGTRHSGH